MSRLYFRLKNRFRIFNRHFATGKIIMKPANDNNPKMTSSELIKMILEIDDIIFKKPSGDK